MFKKNVNKKFGTKNKKTINPSSLFYGDNYNRFSYLGLFSLDVRKYPFIHNVLQNLYLINESGHSPVRPEIYQNQIYTG